MKIQPASLVTVSLLSGLVACFAGCESTDRRAAMEEARKSVPPMAADETYFDGKIAAHLTIASAFNDRPGPGGKGGHGGRGMRGGGGRHMGGGGGGEGIGHREGPGAGAEDYDPEDSEELRPRYTNSPMPPAMMRLTLTNTSNAPIEVEIRDLNSELGNFATRPDKFTIEPGGTGQPGDMQSLLGLDTMALPVTLALRVDGKTETKVLTLRPVTPTPAAPAGK